MSPNPLQRNLDLGFLAFVAHGDASPERLSAADALSQNLDLITFAEQLGYQNAWVRVRHEQ